MEREGAQDPLPTLSSEVTYLDARPTDDLDWQWEREKRQIFYLDFGILLDEALFPAHALALSEFEAQIPLENVAGVLLYKGSPPDSLEKAQQLSDYLHRLAAELPLDLPIYCHFLLKGSEEPALIAQQLSMRRFEHFELIIEGHSLASSLRSEEASIGLVLPQDAQLSHPEIREEWNALAKDLSEQPFRILPEELINELWFGIDTLIVLEKGLTEVGERMIKGFEATGGEIINPSPKKVTICASEAKPKQRGEAPVCTRNTIAKGKGDEED